LLGNAFGAEGRVPRGSAASGSWPKVGCAAVGVFILVFFCWSSITLPNVGLNVPTAPDGALAEGAAGKRADIVFVIDATGSMQGEIDDVKRNMISIGNELALRKPTPDIRFGAVFYRDRTDEEMVRAVPLSRDLAAVRAEIQGVQAQGGGDWPEHVGIGLHKALEMDWSHSQDGGVRLLYLVGDAPAQHYGDGYEVGDAVKMAQSMGVKIHVVACDGLNDAEMQSVASSTGGSLSNLARTADQNGHRRHRREPVPMLPAVGMVPGPGGAVASAVPPGGLSEEMDWGLGSWNEWVVRMTNGSFALMVEDMISVNSGPLIVALPAGAGSSLRSVVERGLRRRWRGALQVYSLATASAMAVLEHERDATVVSIAVHDTGVEALVISSSDGVQCGWYQPAQRGPVTAVQAAQEVLRNCSSQLATPRIVVFDQLGTASEGIREHFVDSLVSYLGTKDVAAGIAQASGKVTIRPVLPGSVIVKLCNTTITVFGANEFLPATASVTAPSACFSGTNSVESGGVDHGASLAVGGRQPAPNRVSLEVLAQILLSSEVWEECPVRVIDGDKFVVEITSNGGVSVAADGSRKMRKATFGAAREMAPVMARSFASMAPSGEALEEADSAESATMPLRGGLATKLFASISEEL